MRTARLVTTLLALALAILASAQPSPPVRLELGFGGEFVTGAWNPLRLTLRDGPGAVLELAFDQGSLRRGELLATYRAELPGGSGLTVFEDDLFVPPWRAFRWTVRRGSTLVASGALDPRGGRHDERPLDLLLSAAPGRWQGAYPAGSRPVEVAAAELPRRAAAYDGVRTLLIDGSGAVPPTAAVAAAATAGARVLLVGELPASHEELLLLAPGAGARLGAGELRRVAPADLARALAAPAAPAVDPGALLEALEDEGPPAPASLGPATLAVALGGYLVVVLTLVRLGGAPGLLAGLSVALLASLAAAGALQPPQAHYEARRRLELGAGALAVALEARHLLSLPEAEVTSAGALRPADTRPYRIEDGVTRVALRRWGRARLLSRPEVVPARLEWDGVRLVNAGDARLDEVAVAGLGPQPALAPGSSASLAPPGEGPLAPDLAALLALLPPGTAAARGGDALLIALPPLGGRSEAAR